MRNWKPQPSLARWVAIVLFALALAGAIFLLMRFGNALARPPEAWPIDGQLYGVLLGGGALLGLASYLAYRVAGALSLRYDLDRNGLYISWLGNTATVPLAQIETIEPGAGYELPPIAVWAQSIAYYRGQVALPGGRPLFLFSSHAPTSPKSLLVHTADGVYAVSPVDPESFVQELEQRRRLGVIQQLAPTIKRGGLLSYTFWADPAVRLPVLAAVALNLLLLGLTMYAYPVLPPEIQFRFDEAGVLAELRPRHQVLFLPLAATTLLLLNAGLGLVLHSREAVGARLLQFGSIIMQLLFMVATAAVFW